MSDNSLNNCPERPGESDGSSQGRALFVAIVGALSIAGFVAAEFIEDVYTFYWFQNPNALRDMARLVIGMLVLFMAAYLHAPGQKKWPELLMAATPLISIGLFLATMAVDALLAGWLFFIASYMASSIRVRVFSGENPRPAIRLRRHGALAFALPFLLIALGAGMLQLFSDSVQLHLWRFPLTFVYLLLPVGAWIRARAGFSRARATQSAIAAIFPVYSATAAIFGTRLDPVTPQYVRYESADFLANQLLWLLFGLTLLADGGLARPRSGARSLSN